MKIYTLLVLALFTTLSAWAQSEPSLVDGYYQIGTAEELVWFANYVNAGNTSANALLTADIDATEQGNKIIICKDRKSPYEGIFDGQMHSLTIKIETTSSSSEWGLFRATGDATIKRLWLKGSVKANNTVAGTLIGRVDHEKKSVTTEVSQVRCSVSLNGSSNITSGGLVACVQSSRTLVLSDCLFDGEIDMPKSTQLGGFVGWLDSGSTLTIHRALFNPSELNVNETSSSETGTFYRTKLGSASVKIELKKCYYSKAIRNQKQGFAADENMLANGELTYILNGNVDYGWRQTLSRDAAPLLISPESDIVGVNIDGSYINGEKSIALPLDVYLTILDAPLNGYTPTQITNGSFDEEPWMNFDYKGDTYTRTTPKRNRKYTFPLDTKKGIFLPTAENIVFNGVGEGWNTTEQSLYFYSLFECGNRDYRSQSHNENISLDEKYVEMNSQHSCMLYQDLRTNNGDVVRWTLDHAVRTLSASSKDEIQRMCVEVGAPYLNDDGTPKNASGWTIPGTDEVPKPLDTQINPATLAIFEYDGPTDHSGRISNYGYLGKGIENLDLRLSTQSNGWYNASGVYVIPQGQLVTRFGFISESINPNYGNLLDNLTFSTLFGNFSAEPLKNGDVKIHGYWGENDPTKRMIIHFEGKYYAVDMSKVVEAKKPNFHFTIPRKVFQGATMLYIYHEDYPRAPQEVPVHYIEREVKATFDYSYRTGENDEGNDVYEDMVNEGEQKNPAFTQKVQLTMLDGQDDAIVSYILTAPSATLPTRNDDVITDALETHKLAPMTITITSAEGEKNVLEGENIVINVCESELMQCTNYSFEVLTEDGSSKASDWVTVQRKDDGMNIFNYVGYTGDNMFKLNWRVNITGLSMFPSYIFAKPMRNNNGSYVQIRQMENYDGVECQLAGYIVDEEEVPAASATEQQINTASGVYYLGEYTEVKMKKNNTEAYTYAIGLTGFHLDGRDYFLHEQEGSVPKDMISANDDKTATYLLSDDKVHELNADGVKITYDRDKTEIPCLLLTSTDEDLEEGAVVNNQPYILYVNQAKDGADGEVIREVDLSQFAASLTGSSHKGWVDAYDAEAIYMRDGKYTFHLGTIGTTTLLSQWQIDPIVIYANQDPDHPADYYRTYYNSQIAFEIPEGVTAYTAKLNADLTKMLLTPIKGNILPKEEAVVFKSGTAKIELLPVKEGGVSNPDNELLGVDVVSPQDPGFTYYMLSYGQYKLGLYQMGTLQLDAHRGFFKIDNANSAAQAKAFAFDFGEENTSIATVNEDQRADFAVYNMQGQRVADSLENIQGLHGLYIVGGKKIVITDK